MVPIFRSDCIKFHSNLCFRGKSKIKQQPFDASNGVGVV